MAGTLKIGGGASVRPERSDRLPDFFYRLSSSAQRTYLKSDAIDRFEIAPSRTTQTMMGALLQALENDSLPSINQSARALVNELCRLAMVPAPRTEIRGVRPHNRRGELHGIFYPELRPPKIVLWMRTARRHEVVKPRTFVRTLAHELGHHLDYALLKLDVSYHTRGFFRRESFLTRLLHSIGT